MSGTIDDRIVSLKFDNQAFESRLSETIKSLDGLSKSLQFKGAADGFNNITSAADHVNLSGMSSALDNISSKFSAMGAVGFSVISNLTTSALEFAKTVADKVLDPILGGGKQRAINIDNAKFAFRGLGMDVQGSMDDALAAVRGTSFGLDEAAKAAAQFGASGIKSGADMTQSLRGIAGIAAMTNRSFSEIADIMTSSAATGKVTNMDLEQFATRGLNAAAAYAKATGMTEAQVHQMATAGTLDYASFAKAMDDTFGAHAQEANQTFTGAMANMHAALSRLGAAFIAPQLDNQKNLFNALSPAIDGVAKALQPVINMFTWFSTMSTNRIVDFLGALDFTKLQEPMKNFADGIGHIFTDIQAFVAPIKTAFGEIFPVDALGTLTGLSDSFENFTASLKIGGETAAKVENIFVGVFSIFDIVWTVLKELVFTIFSVVEGFSGAGGGLLNFASGLGSSLSDLDNFLVKGGALHDFFLKLRQDIAGPIVFLQQLGGAIADFFRNLTGADAVDDTFGRVNSRIQGTESFIQQLEDRLSGVIDVFDKVWNYVKTWATTFGQKLAAAFKPGDFDSAVDIINVGLLGGVLAILHKFSTSTMHIDLSGGLFDKMKLAFGNLTNTLKTMQLQLKAEALMKIAEAVGILVISIVALSLIDSDKLTKALTAIGVGFGELMGVMALVNKLVDSKSAALKLGIVGAALIEFSIAAAVLTLAIRNLSGLSWEEIGKGLAGVAGGMLILIGASQLMADNSVTMVAAGVGMIAISTGLLILSEAVKAFGNMDWGVMGKGLLGVAGGLLIVAGAMNLMPASSVISGLGFIEIAIGLNILYLAVKDFGSLDWGVMGKGLLGIAGALLIVAAAMNLMPISLPITAAGILILSVALNIMAEAVKILGNMDMGTIAKGLFALAGMMLILVVAVNAMSGALTGAAAMVIVAGALVILTEVLEKLGAMKISDLIQGLLAIAAVFAVLGIAAALMEPVIPALLGLAVALALVGASFALFGGGVWMLSKGLETLATSGAAGLAAFVDMLKTLVTAIPELIGAFILSVVSQVDELAKSAPLLVRLLTVVIDQVLDTIIQLSPKIGAALIAVLKAALGFIQAEFPQFVQTGFQMLLAILQGIRDNIGHIVEVVAEIIVNFIDALTKKVPDIVDSVYNLLVTVLTSVAEKLGQAEFLFLAVAEAFVRGFITGFTTYMPGIADFFIGLPGNILGWIGDLAPTLLTKGIDLLTGFLTGVVQKAIDLETWWLGLPFTILGWIGDVVPTLLTKGLDIITGFLTGVVQGAIAVETWWIGLPAAVIGWIGDVVPTLVTKGVDIIGGFLNGVIVKAIEVEAWWIGLPGAVLGWLGDVVPTLVGKGVDIIKGFLDGIVEKAIDVMNWYLGLPGQVLGWLVGADVWLVDKGHDILAGLLSGITEKFGDIMSWALGLGDSIKNLIGNAAGWLAQVGIDMIKGLWDGIGSMAGWLKDKVTGLAGDVVDDFKSGFGILGSPSKHLCDIGKQAGLGLANGLLDMSNPVRDAATHLNDQVANSFNPEMTVEGINRVFNEMVSHLEGLGDFNPTITPVLDLTKVKMGAQEIGSLMDVMPISPTTSFEQARLISTTADLSKSAADPAAQVGPTEITFNQNNYSPEALSVSDIYRNTNSQIARAKEELGIS